MNSICRLSMLNVTHVMQRTCIRTVTTTIADNAFTKVTERDGIRSIVLNNPKTRNALSFEMMSQLLTDIKRNRNDENLRCIILSGNGPVFSAGHNLKELTNDTGIEFHQKVFEKCTELMLEIVRSPVPIIAKIDGLAAAAGCQLATTCDIVVCSNQSSFSTPGANFGIFCSTPGIAVARSVTRKKTLYMLLTGLPISANEALNCGLVTSVVPVDELDNEVNRICHAIQTKSRAVIERGKRFFYDQIGMNVKTAYAFGEQEMVSNINMKDGREGVKSFVEKRKPIWTHSTDE